MMSMFLNQEEVDLLTGIRRGRTEGRQKLTKYQRQVAFLRGTGIPFVVNAAGRPVITRAALEGSRAVPPAPTGWQSNAR
ncbi:DUF4224 domain-containing protein [Laribacter hongkongensis]|uniref:DUF4224 domain-containing protein n=1 Tax=Laribacter hongkongensis TaxID=168471 RepID=UPI001EFD4784|nr:DUF4224 domain-containing protein [Laribacter hongkongensis]MCG9124263.1 DUF4224 domain-containing protein [Laribacter hongkongensis]